MQAVFKKINKFNKSYIIINFYTVRLKLLYFTI